MTRDKVTDKVTDKVLVTIDGGLMTITLNRPEVRNAVDRDVSDAVGAAVDELDEAPTCGSASSLVQAARSAPAWT